MRSIRGFTAFYVQFDSRQNIMSANNFKPGGHVYLQNTDKEELHNTSCDRCRVRSKQFCQNPCQSALKHKAVSFVTAAVTVKSKDGL